MSVLTISPPEFVYPTATQHPFDGVCKEIIHALAARDWQAPGITVKLSQFGSGKRHYRLVRELAGNGWQLHFNRQNGYLDNGYFNTTAASEIILPGNREVHVRSHKSSEVYTQIEGQVDVSPSTAILEEFANWLRKHVLTPLLGQPETTTATPLDPEPIPFPRGIGAFFCRGSVDDRYRVTDRADQKPQDQFALDPRGMLLAHLGLQDAPEEAYQGFRWCGIGELAEDATPANVDIPGTYFHRSTDQHLFRVQPKYANDIYVANHQVFETVRTALFEEVAPRERLHDWEINRAYLARAKTIVPITEYDRSFAAPVVLIARELDFDEVTFVR